jgi:hypothetical protein
VAQTLKRKPPNLRRISQRHGGALPKDEIASHIDGREDMPAHGTKEMPVWGDSLAKAVPDQAEREQRIGRAIEMLVAYLATIQE